MLYRLVEVSQSLATDWLGKLEMSPSVLCLDSSRNSVCVACGWEGLDHKHIVVYMYNSSATYELVSCFISSFLRLPGIDYEAVRAEFPTDSFVKVFTFNSARKSMSTVLPLAKGGFRLFTKGASEIVLSKCTRIIAENGRIAPLSELDKKDILSNVVQSMASGALRTIGLAYRSVMFVAI